jgi:hypothetical protein
MGAERKPETTRMFDNDILERFSRIHPSTPFLVWIPVAACMIGCSVVRHDLGVPAIVGSSWVGF